MARSGLATCFSRTHSGNDATSLSAPRERCAGCTPSASESSFRSGPLFTPTRIPRSGGGAAVLDVWRTGVGGARLPRRPSAVGLRSERANIREGGPHASTRGSFRLATSSISAEGARPAPSGSAFSIHSFTNSMHASMAWYIPFAANRGLLTSPSGHKSQRLQRHPGHLGGHTAQPQHSLLIWRQQVLDICGLGVRVVA